MAKGKKSSIVLNIAAAIDKSYSESLITMSTEAKRACGQISNSFQKMNVKNSKADELAKKYKELYNTWQYASSEGTKGVADTKLQRYTDNIDALTRKFESYKDQVKATSTEVKKLAAEQLALNKDKDDSNKFKYLPEKKSNKIVKSASAINFSNADEIIGTERMLKLARGKLAGAKIRQHKLESTSNPNVETKAFAQAAADVSKYQARVDELKQSLSELKTIENLLEGSEAYDKAKTIAVETYNAQVEHTAKKLTDAQEKTRRLANAQLNVGNQIDVEKQKIANYGNSVFNNMQKVSSAYQQADAIANSSLQRMSNGLAKLATTAIRSIGNTLTGVFKKAAKVCITQFGRLLKVFGNTVKKAYGLQHIMKLLIQYGFGFRSLYFLVNNLKDAIGDGIQYLAQATKSANKQVAETALAMKNLLSTIKKLVYFLKSASSTMVAPFIPLVNSIIPKLVTFFDALTERVATFIATLTGQKYIIKASNNLEDYANALDETASSAKDATKALGAYDKLNVIDQGSGGSGSTTSIDTSDWFTSKEVGGSANELAEMIKNSWANVDFTDVGNSIGTKLRTALESIDWTNTVQAMTVKIATCISTFINGISQSNVIAYLGTALGNLINTIVMTVNTLFSTIDWSLLGTQIAKGITNLLDTFDASQLGDSIHSIGSAILDLLISALSFTDEQGNTIGTNLGNAIGEFLDNVDIPDLADKCLTLAKLICTNIGDAIYQWATEHPDSFKLAVSIAVAFQSVKLTGLLSPILGKLISNELKNVSVTAGVKGLLSSIGTALSNGLGTLVTSIMQNGLTGTLSAIFEGLSSNTIFTTFSGIGTILGGLVTAVKNFFDMWEEGWNISDGLLTAVGVALVAIGAVILGAPALIAAVVAGIVAVVANLAVVIKDNWSSIKQFFSDLCDSIGQFFSDLWQNICDVWSTVSGWFDEHIITPLSTFFEGVTMRIGQFFEGCWYIIQGVWIVVSDWFDENVIQPVKEWFESVCESISKFFKDAWDKICEVWGTVSDWFKEHIIDPVKTKFDEVCTNIKEFFADAWSGIKETFSPVAEWFTNLGTKIKEAFETATEAVKTLFEDLWTGIKDSFKSAINNVLEGLESAINWIIDKINFLLGKFNKVAKWGAKLKGESYDGVTEIPKVSIPRLAQGAVIPPNKEFMAVLGDQKQGTNIEAPLETIKQALAETLGSYQPVSTNNQPIVLQLNGKTIAQVVWDENKKRYKQTGKSYAY